MYNVDYRIVNENFTTFNFQLSLNIFLLNNMILIFSILLNVFLKRLQNIAQIMLLCIILGIMYNIIWVWAYVGSIVKAHHSISLIFFRLFILIIAEHTSTSRVIKSRDKRKVFTFQDFFPSFFSRIFYTTIIFIQISVMTLEITCVWD